MLVRIPFHFTIYATNYEIQNSKVKIQKLAAAARDRCTQSSQRAKVQSSYVAFVLFIGSVW
jgi:hypothetical protein